MTVVVPPSKPRVARHARRHLAAEAGVDHAVAVGDLHGQAERPVAAGTLVGWFVTAELDRQVGDADALPESVAYSVNQTLPSGPAAIP